MENDTPRQEKEEIEDIGDLSMFDEPESSEAPVHAEKRKLGGEFLFSIVLLILGCFVALPASFIYLLKSPLPMQDVYTFGISYYNLVFIFLISAAVIIVSLLFFFRSSVPVTLVIFMTCLFCCMPLIIGLKNDFTLQQAIENIPFFTHWPFFLRPLYVLVEFLLPAGILAFLFLQLKNIFSKKPNNYIFAGAAGYLAIATFIGFTGLFQAGQPNIMTVLAAKDTAPVVGDDQEAVITSIPEQHSEKGEELLPRLALSSDNQSEIADSVGKSSLQKTLPLGYSESAMIDRKVQLLMDKMDTISKELEQIRISLKGLNRSVTGNSGSLAPATRMEQSSNKNVSADSNQGSGEFSDNSTLLNGPRAPFTKPVVEDQTPAIVEIRHKVEMLTGKVDLLLSRFNQAGDSRTMKETISDNRSGVQPSMTRDQNTLSGELAEVLKKIELLSDKVNRISDTLAQKGDYGTEQQH